MLLHPGDVDARTFYKRLVEVVVPRPIGWVSTTSPDGVDNLAPYSFFNAVASDPPAVMFSATRHRDGSPKHSARNAIALGEFVVNVATNDLAKKMNATSGTFDADASEFDAAGLTRCESIAVRPPGVAEARARLECRVVHHFDVGNATAVVGEVVALFADDGVLSGDAIDPAKLDAVGRMGGPDYCRTRDRFSLGRPG